jgi:hypothetical protein
MMQNLIFAASLLFVNTKKHFRNTSGPMFGKISAKYSKYWMLL